MPVKRFNPASWRSSPLSRRRLDLSPYAKERAVVAEICGRVATEGDAALRELGKKFDGWAPEPGESFEVPKSELAAAVDRLQPEDRDALEFAAKRIRDYQMLQMPAAFLGPRDRELVTMAVRRAGLYAPGGRAPYPSTVLMTAIPAMVAPVRDVALATPPRPDGSVAPALLAAARVAGVQTVYRVGGAQAIAAFAFGTETIPPVDVIAGPGNIYVTLAKKEVFGAVGIDGIAGPTEVAVLADGSVRPDLVAADLAAQLEHDPLAIAILFTDSATLAQRVEEELANLILGLDRAEIIRQANCCLVIAEDMGTALELVNEFAPEHLLIVGEHEEQLSERIESAGAVFVGAYSTVPLGDYVAGPNHTLPTWGAARFSSALSVHTFLRRMSIMRFGRDDLEAMRGPAVRLARLEGLGAHAHAVEVRLE